MSKKLAKYYHLNQNKAYIAGVFHDITKHWTTNKHKKYLKKYLPKFLNEPKLVWHSYTGYLYLKYKLLFKNRQILNAVKWHTVGHPNMTQFEMLVFVADKISIERNYIHVTQYRKLAFINLKYLFKLIILNQFKTIYKNNKKNINNNNFIKTYKKWIKNI